MGESEGNSKKVPVLRSSNSLIEDEFDSLRSRFDDEMRLIEAEMERFKSHMMSLGNHSDTKGAMPPCASSGSHTQTTRTTSKTTTTTRSSKTSSLASSQLESKSSDLQERVDADNCTAAAKTTAELVASSPLVVDNEGVPGSKMLRLRFDLSDFEPEQIVVKTVDNRLQVYAKREQLSPNKSLFSEYNREFLLPAGTQPDQIKSTLSADGVLTIEAPLPNKI